MQDDKLVYLPVNSEDLNETLGQMAKDGTVPAAGTWYELPGGWQTAYEESGLDDSDEFAFIGISPDVAARYGEEQWATYDLDGRIPLEDVSWVVVSPYGEAQKMIEDTLDDNGPRVCVLEEFPLAGSDRRIPVNELDPNAPRPRAVSARAYELDSALGGLNARDGTKDSTDGKSAIQRTYDRITQRF